MNRASGTCETIIKDLSCINRVQEGGKKENRANWVFEEIMTKNVTNLSKAQHSHPRN